MVSSSPNSRPLNPSAAIAPNTPFRTTKKPISWCIPEKYGHRQHGHSYLICVALQNKNISHSFLCHFSVSRGDLIKFWILLLFFSWNKKANLQISKLLLYRICGMLYGLMIIMMRLWRWSGTGFLPEWIHMQLSQLLHSNRGKIFIKQRNTI